MRNDRDALLDAWSRTTAQKVGLEADLWMAETLLKQCTSLLPRLIAETPADSVARDSLVEQATEFLLEPRHHPTITALPGDGDIPMMSSGDARQGGIR